MENIFLKKLIEKINSGLETTKTELENVKTAIKNACHMEK